MKWYVKAEDAYKMDDWMVKFLHDHSVPVENDPPEHESEGKESRNGSYLGKVDNALPGKYTRQLYGILSRNRAYLLT